MKRVPGLAPAPVRAHCRVARWRYAVIALAVVGEMSWKEPRRESPPARVSAERRVKAVLAIVKSSLSSSESSFSEPQGPQRVGPGVWLTAGRGEAARKTVEELSGLGRHGGAHLEPPLSRPERPFPNSKRHGVSRYEVGAGCHVPSSRSPANGRMVSKLFCHRSFTELFLAASARKRHARGTSSKGRGIGRSGRCKERPKLSQ